MANRCWLNGTSSSPSRQVVTPFIAFVATFSIPSVARTVSFFQTWSELDTTTPFLALLPGVAVPVSAASSVTLFGVLFKIVSSDFSRVSFLWRASWIDPSVVRFCHTPDLLSPACLTCCTVARGRPRLCSRSDLLQDLGGLIRCQHGPC